RAQIGDVDCNSDAIVFLNLSSSALSPLELTDYAERVLVERLGVLPGVARVRLNGARRYAMRVWLDRGGLRGRGGAGRLESSEREFTLRPDTGLESEQDFRQLAIGRGPDGYLVRLDEVADVR